MIDSILSSDFPYQDPKIALEIIRKSFFKELDYLIGLKSAPSDSIPVRKACKVVLNNIFRYLPILGFILRSTNVRNAFEFVRPFQRISNLLFANNSSNQSRSAKLILSSEWDYSPYVYRPVDGLPGFILIGFPATESSNPLLFPLAGHELGHLLWSYEDLFSSYKSDVNSFVVEAIKSDLKGFKRAFPHLTYSSSELFEKDVLDVYPNTWAMSALWSLKQAEELFSDFIGLRLFGLSYLHAFAYLLSPTQSGYRSENYPNMNDRVSYLLQAAQAFNINPPDQYGSLFDKWPVKTIHPEYAYRISVADTATSKIVDELITKADNYIQSRLETTFSDECMVDILSWYDKVVPPNKVTCFADIFNAAWAAYQDDNFWRDYQEVHPRKDRILKDLVLKSIEVYDIDEIRRSMP